VKVSLVKDMQDQLRRDLFEQKEAFYTEWLTGLIKSVLDFAPLGGQELHLRLKVASDDGNLPCAFSFTALDLLTQVDALNKKASLHQGAPKSLMREAKFFTTMVLQSMKGQFFVDPTFQEMFISNNHLVITLFPSGKQLVEKSLCFRTQASQVQPLEQKPQAMSLLDVASGVMLARKPALQAFKMPTEESVYEVRFA